MGIEYMIKVTFQSVGKRFRKWVPLNSVLEKKNKLNPYFTPYIRTNCRQFKDINIKNETLNALGKRTSLVVQWLRICLPMQGTRVRSLVGEDPTCRGATKHLSHNYWAHVPRAHAPQQEKPPQWEAHAPQWRVAPTHRN